MLPSSLLKALRSITGIHCMWSPYGWMVFQWDIKQYPTNQSLDIHACYMVKAVGLIMSLLKTHWNGFHSLIYCILTYTWQSEQGNYRCTCTHMHFSSKGLDDNTNYKKSKNCMNTLQLNNSLYSRSPEGLPKLCTKPTGLLCPCI